MDLHKATKRQITDELLRVLSTLRDVLATQTLPTCLEKTNAVYFCQEYGKHFDNRKLKYVYEKVSAQ